MRGNFTQSQVVCSQQTWTMGHGPWTMGTRVGDKVVRNKVHLVFISFLDALASLESTLVSRSVSKPQFRVKSQY